mmetsp:Transcript_44789/g.173803  ORF Transcript_44789/g.173803 Transcript_44789/m.173803 type:complete len:152 (+) Transcript_44789:453-908(+)
MKNMEQEGKVGDYNDPSLFRRKSSGGGSRSSPTPMDAPSSWSARRAEAPYDQQHPISSPGAPPSGGAPGYQGAPQRNRSYAQVWCERRMEAIRNTVTRGSNEVPELLEVYILPFKSQLLSRQHRIFCARGTGRVEDFFSGRFFCFCFCWLI